MAYSVGEVFHKQFGVDSVAVNMNGESALPRVFEYEREPNVVKFDQLFDTVTPEDFLLVSPSFSSYGLGLRLNCTKLMYLQGFNTFNMVDGFFDRRISVSTFVANLVRNTYGFETSVIPAFIRDTSHIAQVPWWDRRSDVVLVSTKGGSNLELLVEQRILSEMRSRHPSVRFEPLRQAGIEKQSVFLARLASARYLLTLSLGEGFGLVPLEAMALGVVVMGFDGFGGREYMRPGVNCAVTRYPDIVGLVDAASNAMGNDDTAFEMSEQGRKTAVAYSKTVFEQRWADYIRSEVL